MSDSTDDAFEQLLRRVARTPEVTAIRRGVAPGSRLADRFTIERQLGEGGMGQVFAAFDANLQTRVALKILGSLTPRSITAIKREFRAASELAHPNLVRLHELFCDGVEWFFTMDLVEGASLSSALKQGRARARDPLEDLFRELAVALRALHAAGLLHGDLKPSNFLVTKAEGKIVLLDFGLARPPGASREHLFAGTPEYMAPEQAQGKDLNEAADWYSYGVVLFEALTGKLPAGIELERELKTVPQRLGELCLALLDEDPARRPSGEAVLEAFGGVETSTRTSVPPPVRAVLLGRQAELAYLNADYERAQSGHVAVILVHGPPGIGKTALLEQFIASKRGRGAIALSGRCRERESVGYKAIDGLIDDIVALLDGLPEREAAELLPDDVEDLTRLFPALRVAAAIAGAPKRRFDIPDQTVAKHRAIGAFRQLLARLGARAPLIVWLDDLQWSDAESALLLEPLLSDSAGARLLLVGSYRSSSGSRGPMLEALFDDDGRALPAPRTLELQPLSFEEARRLALQLLPKDALDPDALSRTIARDAGGNPLFISELAHFSDFSERLASPSTLTELVSNRLAALGNGTRELLETVAIAGAPLSRAVAREARGLSPVELEHSLGTLRANRLSYTRRVGEEDQIDVLHDRIREIIVQSVAEGERRAHHLSLARALSADPSSKPHALATHYQAAGLFEEAGRHWILAGDQAFQALAFNQAADFFALGVSQASLDPSARQALELRRAESLAAAGKGALAADTYLACAAKLHGGDALELQRRAAEQLLLSGHLERGLGVIEDVLRTLGMRQTRSGHRGFLSILAGRLRVRTRGLRYDPRREHEIPARELARVDASWTIACSLGVTDFVRGADFQNDHLLLALNAGEPRRLLRALTLEISYGATPGVGSERRTQTLLGLADELVQRMDDDNASALAHVSRGVAAYLQGKISASLAHCEEAVRILSQRCVGAVWETVTAQRFMIASLFALGRFRDLAELVPPFVAEAEIQGNLYAASYFRTSYSNTAWLVRDDTVEASRQLSRAREEWTAKGTQLPHCWLLVGQCQLGFYTGDADGTWAKVCERWPDLQAAHFFHVGVLRVQLWHLRAASAALLAEQLARRGQRARASELWSEARNAAKQLGRQAIPSAAPLAGLLEAAVESAEGRREQARMRLGEVARSFDDHGLRLYAAAARARLAALGEGRDASLLRSSAEAAFSQESVENPAKMIDLLAPGFAASRE
ncbi:MAG TPA: protein kinase [Polyangiaceae bacterium]|nr:protein kinase [Polyangiaceae bacterium]